MWRLRRNNRLIKRRMATGNAPLDFIEDCPRKFRKMFFEILKDDMTSIEYRPIGKMKLKKSADPNPMGDFAVKVSGYCYYVGKKKAKELKPLYPNKSILELQKKGVIKDGR